MAAKKKMGRPPILTPDAKTLEQITKLAGLFCTVEDAAAVMLVHRSTLHEFMQRHPEAREAWEMGQGQGRHSLRVKQMALADKNATMAIFLGKQMLGQKDQIAHEVAGRDGGPIEIRRIDARVSYVDGDEDPDRPRNSGSSSEGADKVRGPEEEGEV